MSLQRFGQIVAHVMKTLPAEFEPYLDNVVVDVQEQPDVETLRQLGFTEEEIAQGESLYGLFVPMDLTSPWGGEAIDVRDLPQPAATGNAAAYSEPCTQRGGVSGCIRDPY
jgi:predicted Zn-dependent protease with MMP-like domain